MKHATSLHRYVFFLLMLSALACNVVSSLFEPDAIIYFAPDSSAVVTSDSLSAACQVLQERFDEVLKGNATVSVEEERLRVELTRADDVDLAVQFATAVGAIGFLGSTTPYTSADSIPPDAEYLLTDGDISEAWATMSESSKWQVDIDFAADGAQKLADYSAAHIGEPLTIVQDGLVITSPILGSPIPDGHVIISGNFEEQEARILAARLNSGRLPFQLERVEEK